MSRKLTILKQKTIYQTQLSLNAIDSKKYNIAKQFDIYMYNASELFRHYLNIRFGQLGQHQ